jgi:regulator of replication initiation timing
MPKTEQEIYDEIYACSEQIAALKQERTAIRVRLKEIARQVNICRVYLYRLKRKFSTK